MTLSLSPCRFIPFMLLLLAAALFQGASPALAGDLNLKVSTDKASYSAGQAIKLAVTATYPDGRPVLYATTRSLTLKDPAGIQAASLSATSAGNGNYTAGYQLPPTARPGTWSVKAVFKDSYGAAGEASRNFVVNAPVVDTTAPVTTASPSGGSFTGPVSVVLSASEAATIYYTTDGSTPTTASPFYSGPLTLSASTTLRFFARDSAGNGETVKSASYTITPVATPPGSPHANLTWSGPGTCLPCHAKQAGDVHGSVHYQWKGASPAIVNSPVSGGKSGGAVNAYCINILGNWNGCSACHVGRGAQPTAVADNAQLENIDCLTCHQEKYRRVKVNGTFQPDTAAMAITMDQAVQTLHKPTRATCLQCHARAGGGDAVKRGDIAMAHTATSDRMFDVHMATTGANLACQSCHVTSDHKIPGRGSDLRPSEGSIPVNCSNASCHAGKTSATGHVTAAVNRHVARVACQTCHIPSYARNAADTVASEATETFRTWQQSAYDPAKKQYHPLPTLSNDLKPVYRFWNGTSWAYNLNDPAVVDPATGFYQVSRPVGSVGDPASRLYPFKYKTAEQPLATAVNRLIALDTSVFFATGNAYSAIQAGLVNMGLPAGEPYAMVTTDEFQTLNHQVPPAGQVLGCNDCHGGTARMDLKGQLGYGLKGPASAVCVQCHGYEANPGFLKVHSKHVDSKRYDCSFCHTFSRPERGLKMTR